MSKRRRETRFGLVSACTLALGASLLLAACGAGGDAGEHEADQGHHTAAYGAGGTVGTARGAVPIQKRSRHQQVRERSRRQAVKPPTPDEAAAKRTARSFYAILAKGDDGGGPVAADAASFCGLMSKEARAQTIDYVRLASGLRRRWTCETAVEQLVRRAKRSGAFKGIAGARVAGVNADGDRATVTVRFDHDRGSLPAVTSVPLVKEGGAWKLGSAPTPSAGS
jgi:hypothetical protein